MPRRGGSPPPPRQPPPFPPFPASPSRPAAAFSTTRGAVSSRRRRPRPAQPPRTRSAQAEGGRAPLQSCSPPSVSSRSTPPHPQIFPPPPGCCGVYKRVEGTAGFLPLPPSPPPRTNPPLLHRGSPASSLLVWTDSGIQTTRSGRESGLRGYDCAEVL